MDFSEVLNSREFKDVITITSQTNAISGGGVSLPGTPVVVSTKAVVIPGRGDLRRLDDGTRVTAFIEIYTRAKLSTGGRPPHDVNDDIERVADIVTWHGARYVVAAIEDYSAFGPGFFKASCDLIELNPKS